MNTKIILLSLLMMPMVLGATWSPDAVDTIQQNLPNGYEPSGIVYHDSGLYIMILVCYF